MKKILALLLFLILVVVSTSATNETGNYTTTGAITVYEAPNSNSSVIEYASFENLFFVRDYGESWLKICTQNGRFGYIKGIDGSLCSGSSVKMYNLPDESSDVLRNIPTGTEIDLIELSSDLQYAKTFYDGTYGYVEVKDLAMEAGGIISTSDYEDEETVNKEDSEESSNNEKTEISTKSKKLVFGIDISHWQGNDFPTSQELVEYINKNDIQFVYIRCGGRGYGSEGELYEDTAWKDFASALEEAGVKYGLYFYSTAINETEALEEAKYILQCEEEIEGYRYNVLPIALDIEQRRNSRTEGILSTGLLRDLAQSEIDLLRKNNFQVLIYSDVNTYEIASLYQCKDCDFWLAQLTDVESEYLKVQTSMAPEDGEIVIQQVAFGGTEDEVTDYNVTSVGWLNSYN